MTNDASSKAAGVRNSRASNDDGQALPKNFLGRSWLPKLRDAECRRKIIRTIWTCMCIFSVGLISGQLGPAFLDLQLITRTTVQQASTFFTATSAGNMVGSVLSGVIYDHVSKDLLLIISTMMMGLLTLAIPFCSHYWLMVTACFLLYAFRQGTALVCNADVLRIWGADASPFLQALHFVFAVGGIVAPLITEPFLAPRNRTRGSEDDDRLIVGSASGGRSSSSNNDTPYHQPEADYDLDIDIDPDLKGDLAFDATRPPPRDVVTALADSEGTETRVHFAFIICCLVCLVTLTPFVVEYFRDHCPKGRKRTSREPETNDEEGKAMRRDGCAQDKQDPLPVDDRLLENCSAGDRNNDDDNGEEKTSTEVIVLDADEGKEFAGFRSTLNLPTVPHVIVVIWMSLFYLVYLGAQLTAWSYLATYAVLQLQWSKSQGALLTSFLWISLAFSRFVCIFLARCLSPARLLAASFTFFIPSLLGLAWMSLNELDWGVWLFTGLVGASMSPIYAAAFSWMNRSLVPVTGKINSCIDLTSNAGVLTTLTVLGHLIEHQGPIWITYLMIGEAILSFLIFISLFLFSRFYLRPKYGEREVDIIVSFTSGSQSSEQLEHCIKDAPST